MIACVLNYFGEVRVAVRYACSIEPEDDDRQDHPPDPEEPHGPSPVCSPLRAGRSRLPRIQKVGGRPRPELCGKLFEGLSRVVLTPVETPVYGRLDAAT